MIPFLAAALRMAVASRGAGIASSLVGGGRVSAAATNAGKATADVQHMRWLANRERADFTNLQRQLNQQRGKTPLLPQEKAQLASAQQSVKTADINTLKARQYERTMVKQAEAIEKATEQQQQMTRAMTYTAIAGTQAHRIITGLANAISSRFVTGLKGAIDVLDAAAGPIEQLVRIHNPARADLFVKRMNDAYAVIGRMLIPVLDAFTRAAIKVGNTMAALEPVFKPLMIAVSGFVDMLATKFTEYIRKHGGLMERFIDVAARVVDVTTNVVSGMFKLLDILIRISKYLPSGASAITAAGLGRGPSRFDPSRSALGASANQARFVSAKTASDEAIKSAMMQGLTPPESPELKEMRTTAEYARKIYEFITRSPGAAIRTVSPAVGPAAAMSAGPSTVASRTMPSTSISPGYDLYRFLTGRRY